MSSLLQVISVSVARNRVEIKEAIGLAYALRRERIGILAMLAIRRVERSEICIEQDGLLKW